MDEHRRHGCSLGREEVGRATPASSRRGIVSATCAGVWKNRVSMAALSSADSNGVSKAPSWCATISVETTAGARKLANSPAAQSTDEHNVAPAGDRAERGGNRAHANDDERRSQPARRVGARTGNEPGGVGDGGADDDRDAGAPPPAWSSL
jgi:hypothetical protein